MQIVKDIYLDFYQSEPVLVTAKEGDVGRFLHVTLLDNGNIFPVPSGSTVTFSRDDVWNGCTVNDDGTILAPITADMRPGRVPAQIEVSSGNDHLSSWNFILDVQNSARNDAAIEGNNDFSAIQTLLDQVQDAIDDTNTAIANVNAAIANMGDNFASLANNQSISQLATNSKTLVGGINELNSKSIGNNAGGHNSIFRGKNLGTSFTSEMSSAIQDGTFDDLFVGDYMTINGTVYRVAGFDLIKNCGDNSAVGNNMCLVPDSALYNAQMHNTDSGEYESGSVANDTTGAYANSDMRTTNLTQATNKIITDFGSSHVISYRDMLPNATADEQASGFAWYDCKVELMSEVMVYGTKVWGNSGYEVGCLNEQFPLFRLNPESIHRRFLYWLRSVQSSTNFALVDAHGFASNADASYSLGVRPFFFVN